MTMGLPARADLVLRFGLEIAGIMALVQLFFMGTVCATLLIGPVADYGLVL